MPSVACLRLKRRIFDVCCVPVSMLASFCNLQTTLRVYEGWFLNLELGFEGSCGAAEVRA